MLVLIKDRARREPPDSAGAQSPAGDGRRITRSNCDPSFTGLPRSCGKSTGNPETAFHFSRVVVKVPETGRHPDGSARSLRRKGRSVALKLDSYVRATPPAGAVNADGDTEVLLATTMTHRFVDQDGTTYHLVTAGPPDGPPVLVLHGMPESWYAWHNQLDALARAGHFVVAPDMIGYGQSDKRLDLDYTTSGMAAQTAGVLDQLGIERLHVVAADRGVIVADKLFAVPGMQERIVSYVRMQQSGNRPHSEPKPPHDVFASERGVMMFGHPEWIPRSMTSYLVAHPIDPAIVERMRQEWSYPGIPEAISTYFRSTNFDIELEERLNGLFDLMTCPVLFLQGSLDPGQQPHEYDTVAETVANGELQFIEAGHFTHLEATEETNEAILDWLQRHAS